MLEIKVAAKVAYFVFLFPVIISLALGSFVMAEVLNEPERELNMWPFKFSGTNKVHSDSIKIISLQQEYSSTTPINIQVSITDPAFDCGDLYITIYDLNSSPKQVVTQSGYFGQCFQKENLMLPVDDKFSEKIGDSGQYEIVAEINDKHYKKIITTSEKFTVK
ncbi:MAG TPA: hypothetical protein VD689_00820 [Nitrosopumilaceae archaeon]|nr:hypothetical protein [Nitrosopumilaceae archaeon]